MDVISRRDVTAYCVSHGMLAADDANPLLRGHFAQLKLQIVRERSYEAFPGVLQESLRYRDGSLLGVLRT